jgi:hypothetical protein
MINSPLPLRVDKFTPRCRVPSERIAGYPEAIPGEQSGSRHCDVVDGRRCSDLLESVLNLGLALTLLAVSRKGALSLPTVEPDF